MSPLQKQPVEPVRETNAVDCENHTNTKIHPVGRMQNFGMLKRVADIVTTGLERFDDVTESTSIWHYATCETKSEAC
jgi:hypothetical protein